MCVRGVRRRVGGGQVLEHKQTTNSLQYRASAREEAHEGPERLRANGTRRIDGVEADAIDATALSI